MKDSLEVIVRRISAAYRYELVVMWNYGMKDTFQFKSEEAAKTAERGIKKAFGGQVVFTCINKIRPSIFCKRGSRE